MKRFFANLLFLFGCFLSFSSLQAQDSVPVPRDKIDGQIVGVGYQNNDTLLVSDLEGVSISIPRSFDSVDDQIRYRRYKRKATKVFPYAVEAIKIFREVEEVTKTMKKKKRKKHVKKLHKKLKKEFTDPLKNLSKTEGKILIEMIEKELDKSFYNLMKDLRGGLTAASWNTLSKMYGYKLKDKYVKGEDKILDAVLFDLDVSHN